MQIPEPEVAVRGVAISRDGSLLSAVNSEGNCFIWSMQDGECTPLRKIAVHEGAYAISCKFSPDNRFLCTTSSDMTAKLWDADRDFDLAHTLTGHTAWVWGCAFSGDSNYVITGTYSCLVFSQSNEDLLFPVSSDHTGAIWNTDRGERVVELKGHQKPVLAIALSDAP